MAHRDGWCMCRDLGLLFLSIVIAGCGAAGGGDSDPLATSPTVTSTATPTPRGAADLVMEGARIFFQETFDGNGRTCGTCHPAANDFTLSPEFIAQLPADDPLFIAEREPALAELENPALMRSRALILENVDGFDQPPVFRGVPHIFSLAFTAPFGWSGDELSLRAFAIRAVEQHFTRSLRRQPGVDFRMPSETELAALEAFMRAQALPADARIVPVFGVTIDLDAFVLTDAQRRGRDRFFSVGCTSCHDGPLLTNGGVFDTGVTRQPVNVVPPPGCRPPCDPIGPREHDRAFDVPMLFDLARTAPFFHDNSAATLRDAVAFYTSEAFRSSPQGQQFVFDLDDTAIDDLTAFLTALSPCGNGVVDHGEACDDGNTAVGDGCRPTCTIERCGDGIVDPQEQCDDGNQDDGDGCGANCTTG